MNYEELSAKDLRELCEKRNIKPSRAKADMIEDLKAKDAVDELTRLDQEMEQEALEASVPVVEAVPVPETPVAPEKPAEGPSEAQVEEVWVKDGRLYKRYDRLTASLSDHEHRGNLADVREEAASRGRTSFGPAFRVRGSDSSSWVYAINVR